VIFYLDAAYAVSQAIAQTPGVILGGMRIMAVDGTVLDVPDSEANARVFGYPVGWAMLALSR